MYKIVETWHYQNIIFWKCLFQRGRSKCKTYIRSDFTLSSFKRTTFHCKRGLKKTNKSKRIQNIFFCRECKKRRNIRKAEENRYCYLNLKGRGRDIKYSSNGKELEDKIIEIFRRFGNKKKIPWEFVAKEVFSLKKNIKLRTAGENTQNEMNQKK